MSRLPDHFNVRFAAQQTRDAFTEQLMVVRQQDADGFGLTHQSPAR